MSKHTPGPWEVDFKRVNRGNDVEHWEIIAPMSPSLNPAFGPYNIADTLNRHHCISPDEDAANAHIMAAAWEMLKALRFVLPLLESELDCLERSYLPEPNPDEERALTYANDAVRDVTAAIAKAEGK